jgi:hypothetical protein
LLSVKERKAEGFYYIDGEFPFQYEDDDNNKIATKNRNILAS